MPKSHKAKATEAPSLVALPPAATRQPALDFLRGCAILFMVLTHVIVIHYRGIDPTVQFFSWWGGTVCFTIFLFVFSTVYGMKIQAHKLHPFKELRRMVFLFIGYLIIASWVHLLKSGVTSENIGRIREIVTLQLQPEYTEFIFSFVLFVGVTVLFSPLWRWLLARPLLWLLWLAAVFVWAQVLYVLPWGEGYWQVLKSYIVGANQLHTFPILSYFPVYGLGLLWGFHSRTKEFNALVWGGVGALIALGWWLLLRILNMDMIDRWPPNTYFLLHGLSFVFVILGFYKVFDLLPLLNPVIRFIGRHPFEYYLFHLILLMPFFRFAEQNPFNEVMTIATFGLTMAVSSYLILIKPTVR